MQLTRAADYAIRIVIHMTSLPAGTRLPLGTLATAVGVPQSFLSKVLQALTRAGLLVSRRGTDGGFELAPSKRQLTMLDVIEAVDGPIQLNICLRDENNCERSATCLAHPVWMRAQDAMVGVLRSAVITDMVHSSRSMHQVPGLACG